MLKLLSTVVIFTSLVDILKCFSDKMLYMHEIEDDMLEVTQLPFIGKTRPGDNKVKPKVWSL